ncbi:hypothetical protein KY290_013860 [Solanum tuberosum]|uniref:Ulp1 protease family, C-terminal catalytic domain containing protein n=1 Tax=Solanum tuberosum TaxID=4113 RepID=A0ABQ7VMZ7_SOLTU|nr:hypothetical protein KY289_013970 [Solanum tuberosum]KAH0769879.1 hypothetical protein KY290_013860 [Solanum tuberosum]
MTYALNVWTYKCASQLNPEIVFKERDVIPRICNWRVVALNPKFEMLMSSIVQENACSNIVPTSEELATIDLPEDEHALPYSPPTTSVNPKIVQSNDIADFDDFSTRSPEQLLRRSSRVSDISSPPPPKRRKKGDTPKTKVSEPSKPDQSNVSLNQPFSNSDVSLTPAANVHGSADAQRVNYIDKKFEKLVILIKKNHSQLMQSRHKENNNVDPQSSNKQPFPHIRIDLADAVGVADYEVGVSVNEGGHQVNINAEIDHTISNQQQMKHVSELQPTYESTHVDTEANDPKKDDESHQSPQDVNEVIMDEDGADTVQHNIRHFVPDKIIDLIGSHDLLSDSQLSTDISTTEIVVRRDSKAPAPRNRMPSRIIQSPYLTSFASSEKGKKKIDDDVRMYFPFEGCGITYQDLSKLIDEYMQWLIKGLLKNHANKQEIIGG